jgi:putative heme-binding domain-containing protein
MDDDSLRKLLAFVPTDVQASLTIALTAIWRGGTPADVIVKFALLALEKKPGPDLECQAARLIALALGDYNLEHPPLEIFTGYSLPRPVAPATAEQVLNVVRKRFPTSDEHLDDELARLMAMLEDDAQESVAKVRAMWSESSSPTRDVHYLVVLARLRGPRPDGVAAQTAMSILQLDRKLQNQEQRIKQTWGDRLAEIVGALQKRDPPLADALIAHPDFVKPAHVVVANALDADHRARAARMFLKAAESDSQFEWSGALVALLAALPAEEVRPLLRAQWENLALRDTILLQLASTPEDADRDRFLEGLESPQPQVVASCLDSLQRLPRDASGEHLVPLLRLLRRLLREPKETALRAKAMAVIARQTGETFRVDDRPSDPKVTKAAYQPVFDWFRERHPTLLKALDRDEAEDDAALDALKPSINWAAGRADRGESVFRAKACQTCHAGPGKLGPDLAGVTSRFSRDDLWNAVVKPNRDVAPNYRVTMVETRDGKILSGIVAFESADGLILQTSASDTLRIATPDIAARHTGMRSLMPSGLLKDLSAAEIADLFRYLESLDPQRPKAAESTRR